MEDVLSETAVTYPETYVQSMTGGQIKDILEDVCDNLFNADPYHQQGGDMVRIGGFTYSCTPTESVGRRISDVKLDNGRPLEAGKSYKVAGWASVNEQQGKPVWDVFARHLGSGKMAEARGTGVTLKGVDGNPGICRTGMRNFEGDRRFILRALGGAVMAAAMIAAIVPGPRPARAAAGQALRRAPHRAAAFGQRREKTRAS